nr:unnamed protein product [Callosobruchus analis]
MFHQFHLQVPLKQVDEKTVIVMHTSSEFPSGPGQLFLHCECGPRLVRLLTARGRPFSAPKRLSRSEGDLRSCGGGGVDGSPVCPRSQTGSDDSGPRCNTLPAKDLSKISRLFTSAAESEYVVMSPGKTKDVSPKRKEEETEAIVESFYMPMSPVVHSKDNVV